MAQLQDAEAEFEARVALLEQSKEAEVAALKRSVDEARDEALRREAQVNGATHAIPHERRGSGKRGHTPSSTNCSMVGLTF